MGLARSPTASAVMRGVATVRDRPLGRNVVDFGSRSKPSVILVRNEGYQQPHHSTTPSGLAN